MMRSCEAFPVVLRSKAQARVAVEAAETVRYFTMQSLPGHFRSDPVFVQETLSFVSAKRMFSEAVKHADESGTHSQLEDLTPGEYRKSAEKHVKAKRYAIQ